jgi:hypothetical protein
MFAALNRYFIITTREKNYNHYIKEKIFNVSSTKLLKGEAKVDK